MMGEDRHGIPKGLEEDYLTGRPVKLPVETGNDDRGQERSPKGA
jgi:hypothetical protein